MAQTPGTFCKYDKIILTVISCDNDDNARRALVINNSNICRMPFGVLRMIYFRCSKDNVNVRYLPQRLA